jgi:hypothetical protein
MTLAQDIVNARNAAATAPAASTNGAEAPAAETREKKAA